MPFDDEENEDIYFSSEGPSREIIDNLESKEKSGKLEIKIDCNFILDHISQVNIAESDGEINSITVAINDEEITSFKNNYDSKVNSLVVEVMLCEKSSCSER